MTIFVYFGNTVLTSQELRKQKLYAFNTADKVAVNDVISCKNNYSTPFVVANVLDKEFTYYNSTTGDLSNDLTSTAQRKIVTLVLREEDLDVVYGKLV